MINGIMRKFGFISEKELVNVAIEVYERNDTCKNVKDFYYNSGNANAVGYILSRFGIDITSLIRERKKKVVGEEE